MFWLQFACNEASSVDYWNRLKQVVERKVEENILNAADALSSPNKSIKFKGFFGCLQLTEIFHGKKTDLSLISSAANLRDSLKEILFAWKSIRHRCASTVLRSKTLWWKKAKNASLRRKLLKHLNKRLSKRLPGQDSKNSWLRWLPIQLPNSVPSLSASDMTTQDAHSFL